MKRHWHLWVILLIVVGLPICGPLAVNFYDSNPIRYDNFADITDDMTEAQVVALLGCPPGDYRSGHVEYDLNDLDALEKMPLVENEARWQGNHGDILIFRDDENRIIGKLRIPGECEPRVQTWMRWVWEKLRGR